MPAVKPMTVRRLVQRPHRRRCVCRVAVSALPCTATQACARPAVACPTCSKTLEQPAVDLGAVQRERRVVELLARVGHVAGEARVLGTLHAVDVDRKSTRLNSSHSQISYAVFCLKKKKKKNNT